MEDLGKVIEDLIEKRKTVESQVKTQINEEKEEASINFAFKNSQFTKDKPLDKKKEIIKHLQAAKLSHKKWMSSVQILIRLEDIEQAKASIPINYTMCDFGKWYYGEGQILNIYPKYAEMEEIHKSVHDTYLQIDELYIKPIHGSFFNSEKSQIEKRHKKAVALSKILEEYSKIMFDLLLSVESSVKKMSNQDLLNLL